MEVGVAGRAEMIRLLFYSTEWLMGCGWGGVTMHNSVFYRDYVGEGVALQCKKS